MKKLILASASPRRRELLLEQGFEFDIICAEIDERKIEEQYTAPEEAVKALALAKAQTVFKENPEAVVLGADTVVVFKGKTLGKPENKEDAYGMLKCLSGNTHEVITGVALVSDKATKVFADMTQVHFKKLSEEQILSYIAGGSPFDKAGSYGIQDSGFVLKIEGAYDNVVGLPAERMAPILKSMLQDE